MGRKAFGERVTQNAKAATSEELVDAFGDHQAATEEHVKRLEDVFKMLGETVKAKKCEAIEGLAKEAQNIIEETDEGTATRDVALIMAAQKIEHYEIATCGSLVQLAKTIGMTDGSEVLAEMLDLKKREANLFFVEVKSIAEGAAQMAKAPLKRRA